MAEVIHRKFLTIERIKTMFQIPGTHHGVSNKEKKLIE